MSDTDSSLQPRGAIVLIRTIALLLLAFGLFPLANVVAGGSAVPWYRHALILWIGLGGLLLLSLALAARVVGGHMSRAWGRISASACKVPFHLYVSCCALLAFALCAWIAWWCFGAVPHNADEAAQLFHAKILLSGRLSAPLDPNAEFFPMADMIVRGGWHSQFPIGGPFVLALGELIGAAWLVNPMLYALSVVVTAAFVRIALSDGLARATAVLMAVCPFGLFMSASFMNHVPTMLFVTCALWQCARWEQAVNARQRSITGALVGLSLGIAFTIRPLDALASALVIGIVQLTMLWRDRSRWPSIAFEVSAGVLPVIALLFVNARINGSPATLGYEVLYGTSHQLGFHVDPYGTLHTPTRAVRFASTYLLQLNVLLFEWPLPALGVIIAGLFAMRRVTRWDVLLIGVLLSQVVAYALYWHEGSFRGPRFLFTALPTIVVLLARATQSARDQWTGVPSAMATWLIPICVAFSWLAYGINDSVPGRLRQYRSASAITRARPDSIIRVNNLDHALVFVNEGLEARNVHELWSLGFTPGDAARAALSAEPCALHMSIMAELNRAVADSARRRDRVIRSALQAGDATHSAGCEAERLLDRNGAATYVQFFAANEIAGDGRVSGNVVWASDLGARNEVLRSRFGDRRWFRLSADSAGLPRLSSY